MLGLWLLGQEEALSVIGEGESVATARSLLELFRAEEWPGFLWPELHAVTLDGETVLLDLPDLRVSARRTEHIVPSLALRLEDKFTGSAVVYSADTAPCEAVVQLASGAETLVHEASGEHPGHSTAAEAAEVAQRAGVEALYLIHYPALTAQLETILMEAQKVFSGPVHLARDFGAIEF
jgi:ribonuclease Z